MKIRTRTSMSCALALVAASLVACETDASRSPDASDGRIGIDAEPNTVEGAPVFLSFGTNVTALSEGESVTFSAVLTDPDGIDDLIGGSLIDGTIQYGSFSTTGQEGAYSMTLAWSQVDQVRALEFDLEDSRMFEAVFFDVDGHRVSRTVSLRFHCDGDSACDGSCTDKQSDPNNCGTCRNECPYPELDSGDPVCHQATCGGWLGCRRAELATCNEICADEGKICGEACGNSPPHGAMPCSSGNAYSCSDPFLDGARCCCF